MKNRTQLAVGAALATAGGLGRFGHAFSLASSSGVMTSFSQLLPLQIDSGSSLSLGTYTFLVL